ncbi:MAG TPA: signal peptidase II [Bryobacteraceae bacterium]|nr:signal peptidase II [Bryobacteraceae bacterium]
MEKLRAWIIRYVPLVMSLLIVMGDRVTKLHIQQKFTSLDVVTLIPGWLRIVHNENPGAAFGMFAEGNPFLRGIVLIGVSALVLILVGSALLIRSPAYAAPLTRFGLGSVLGGALGNLYDRIAHGTVTDFIEVFHGDWSFPAFNVADSAITVGAILLLLGVLRPGRKPERKRHSVTIA